MSSSHDLVKIAIGDVRVPVDQLTLGQRVDLFEAFAMRLWRHYNHMKGGSLFIPWETENFGEKLTQYSIRRNSLVLDESQYPSHVDYNQKTRVVVLTSHYFRIPDFKLPENGIWKLGDIKLVVRLCLVQNGGLYLEWYEGS